MSGAASRRRGHAAERAVVTYLQASGYPDAITTRAKLGHDGATAPGDIDFHPLVTLEVKDRKDSRWPTWCRQAEAEAPDGTVPVVLRKLRGTANPALWPCVFPTYRWSEVTGLSASPRRGDLEVDGVTWSRTTFVVVVAGLLHIDGRADEIASLTLRAELRAALVLGAS